MTAIVPGDNYGYKNSPQESVLYIVVPFCCGASWRILVVFACKHAVA
jgi:hypothetical protein